MFLYNLTTNWYMHYIKLKFMRGAAQVHAIKIKVIGKMLVKMYIVESRLIILSTACQSS